MYFGTKIGFFDVTSFYTDHIEKLWKAHKK